MSKIKVRIDNPITEWSKYTSVARALRYLALESADVVRGTRDAPRVIKFRVAAESHKAAERKWSDGPRGTRAQIQGLPMTRIDDFLGPKPRPMSLNYHAAVGLRLRSRVIQQSI